MFLKRTSTKNVLREENRTSFGNNIFPSAHFLGHANIPTLAICVKKFLVSFIMMLPGLSASFSTLTTKTNQRGEIILVGNQLVVSYYNNIKALIKSKYL